MGQGVLIRLAGPAIAWTLVGVSGVAAQVEATFALGPGMRGFGTRVGAEGEYMLDLTGGVELPGGYRLEVGGAWGLKTRGVSLTFSPFAGGLESQTFSLFVQPALLGGVRGGARFVLAGRFGYERLTTERLAGIAGSVRVGGEFPLGRVVAFEPIGFMGFVRYADPHRVSAQIDFAGVQLGLVLGVRFHPNG